MQAIAIILCGLAMGALTLPMLHVFQLEGYVPKQYTGWVKLNTARVYQNAAVWVCAAVVLIVRFCPITWVNLIAALLAAAFAWVQGMKQTRGEQVKKKLDFTKRMKRLCLVDLLLVLILVLLGVLEPLALLVGAVFAWAVVLLAGVLIAPVEKGINRHFFNDAKAILAGRSDLIKIGITGSYGKTSTKFILAQILGEKYNVLASPASFNTPMGLTRVIREQLKAEHQVFIAEMGARHVGDIRELTELVAPDYGLITSVGKQHLETFFTLENIVNTKYELIEAIRPDGHAFFANDGGLVRAMYDRCNVPKTLSGFDEGCQVYASDITVGAQGSTFTLHTPQGEIQVSTKLLGRHNIGNILLCCAAALHLGVTLEQIRTALTKLEPVEHRLQIIPGARGVTIIDDAFNSNPVGAKAALDVLAAFPGKRMVITPGMVELGEEEAALNRQFGQQMAQSADYVILMGQKRTQPIAQGLSEGGFDPAHLRYAETMDEAVGHIASLLGPGDAVLFENDLPDQY